MDLYTNILRSGSANMAVKTPFAASKVWLEIVPPPFFALFSHSFNFSSVNGNLTPMTSIAASTLEVGGGVLLILYVCPSKSICPFLSIALASESEKTQTCTRVVDS